MWLAVRINKMLNDWFSIIDMGRKWGGAAVPLSRRAGTPCNTMWPGPWSTSVPSGVLVHPAVWPQ